MSTAYRILAGESEKKWPLWRHYINWVMILKCILKEEITSE
jgi:hypothetical protein